MVRARDSLVYRRIDQFRYATVEAHAVESGIVGHAVIDTYYELDTSGVLTALPGYAWNGASGAIDTRNTIRGSLFHDVIYQMIRREQLPIGMKHRADDLLYDLLIDDGMTRLRAQGFWLAVHYVGDKSCRPGSERPTDTLYA